MPATTTSNDAEVDCRGEATCADQIELQAAVTDIEEMIDLGVRLTSDNVNETTRRFELAVCRSSSSGCGTMVARVRQQLEALSRDAACTTIRDFCRECISLSPYVSRGSDKEKHMFVKKYQAKIADQGDIESTILAADAEISKEATAALEEAICVLRNIEMRLEEECHDVKVVCAEMALISQTQARPRRRGRLRRCQLQRRLGQSRCGFSNRRSP